ncbi:ABC transporter permease [Acetobacterium bakii]|uniref:Glutathione ABC transporter permease n=1 Tax=Acetobacterium bakii TaxID=52689 RepID=A0A0L6TWV7_9FIRM|nr:ABC transporter permease [Acetobacterium bakii]KNZ40749.1 glutathione ABC transporter permease [Acetobacterium bakii]
MIKYIFRRLLYLIPVLILTSFLAYMLVYLSPSSPAQIILQARYAGEPTQEQIVEFNEEYGFDQSILVQYTTWLKNAMQGDLGKSLTDGSDVLEDFIYSFKASAKLYFSSQLLALIIALPIGVYSAFKANSIFDRISRTYSLVGISIPDFWLGMLLVYIFSIGLNLLPSFGYATPKNIILPMLALGLSSSFSLIRIVRTSVLEVLHLNYIRTARSKGLSENQIMMKHALRNAMIPIVTVMGIHLTHFIGGAVAVESMFAWPGLGNFFAKAAGSQDIPVIQGFVLLSAVFFIFANLIIDIICKQLDPRIDYQNEGGKNNG